jgi:hypothetical protein
VKCDSLEIQAGLSTGGAIIGKCQIGNDAFGNMMSLSLPGNQTGTNYAFAQVDSFETIMNCQATNSGNSFRIRNVETARITNKGLSIAPNNGNRNPTQALDVLGNAIVSGTITTSSYTFSTAKPRFRIHRSNFTIPSGTTSLLNGGNISFQSNVTLSAGIFISQIAGVYCVTCKLRLPDNNSQAPEIQWYRRAGSGQQSSYEDFEGWIPAGVSGRRAGMSQCLINMGVGDGVLPRNDLQTMAGCTATFEGFLVQ